MALCSKCGSQLKPGANFCIVCGTRHLAGAGPLPPLPPNPSGGGAPGPGGGASAGSGSGAGGSGAGGSGAGGSGAGGSGAGGSGGAALVPGAAQGAPAAQALLISRQKQQTPVHDQMVIGRDPKCHLLVDVDDVSRQHATIVGYGGSWAVKDLSSRNGTFVNDQEVLAVTPIYHADILRFGVTAEYALYDPAHPRPASGGATGGLAMGGLAQTRAISSPGINSQSPVAPAGPVLYQWPKQPDAEGHVVSLRGPVVIERDGRAGKALLAVGLALINPALAFVPFAMGKNQIMVTTVRLRQVDDGRQVAVTFMGNATSIVEDGDLLAVWGKVEQGTVFAVDVFNYTTQAMFHIAR